MMFAGIILQHLILRIQKSTTLNNSGHEQSNQISTRPACHMGKTRKVHLKMFNSPTYINQSSE